ncbi:MAG: hypothetical protein M3Z35_03940 [Nitrospirota bacterium]|nr:hypothetical protein [Nitrospirota bacterium]
MNFRYISSAAERQTRTATSSARSARSWGPKRGTDKRKFPVIGEVKDVYNHLWDIRDIRDTKHGFDLYFGAPANNHGSYRGGLPRLITTNALRDFWHANRTEGHGLLFDLPAGRTTLKRARRRLGLNQRNDVTEFWTDRIEDLGSLRMGEFAARHSVDLSMAFHWRKKIIGKRARPIGWWRNPETRAILLSGVTLSRIGRRLDISISQAKRLRDQTKQVEWIEGQCAPLSNQTST